MSTDHRETVRRLFDEVWNGRNLAAIESLYSPDFVVDYRPYAPLATGWSAVHAMVERAYATFPDYHEELLSLVVEDDVAAVHLRISGAQRGAWGRVPSTGRVLEFEEMLLLRFAVDGRVVHQRGIVDNLLGLRQAGIIPTP